MTTPPAGDGPFADILVDLLVELGVGSAQGVTGGPIARFVHSLEDHPTLRWVTCRTGAGAVSRPSAPARLLAVLHSSSQPAVPGCWG